MLAMLLLWPLLFAGGGSPAVAAQPSPRQNAVTIIVPPAAAAPLIETLPGIRPVSMILPPPGTETCSATYRRIVSLCAGETCRLHAVDGLDICEGTGFWPR